MTDGDRGVRPGPLLHQHQSHRLADDLAATQNDDLGPDCLGPRLEEQSLNAVRCAGEEPRPALHDAAHVLRMECVDVLERRNRVEDALCPDLFRQWQLNQDSVNVLGRVAFLNEREQFLFSRRGRQRVNRALQSSFFAGAPFSADAYGIN